MSSSRSAYLSLISEQDTWLRNRCKAPEPRAAAYSGVHDILVTPQVAGNLAVQQLLCSGTVQTKLAINQPGDVYEEADRVAEQVMRMAENLHRSCAGCQSGGTPCPKCETEKATVAQRKKLVVHLCALGEG
jgi:hypothetical protein